MNRSITTAPSAAAPFDPAFGPPPPWQDLAAGTAIDIVKLAPDGGHVVTYPGTVLASGLPGGWTVTEAKWVKRPVDLDGLIFHTGDRLIESFSPETPFNCFAVYDPDTGRLRGWYANVTYPARLESGAGRPRLTWHDLYLDLIARPDGFRSVRDRDELDASGLADSDPDLYRAILAAGERLRDLIQGFRPPFAFNGGEISRK